MSFSKVLNVVGLVQMDFFFYYLKKKVFYDVAMWSQLERDMSMRLTDSLKQGIVSGKELITFMLLSDN